jgi:predicted acyltransferase
MVLMSTKVEGTGKRLTPPSQRIISIDRFRGIVVFLMILFDILNLFDNLGFLSMIGKHPDTEGIKLWDGLTVADLGAPMFMFAIALTLELSYNKRVSLYGKKETIKHSIIRWVSILSIGAMIDHVEIIIDGEWEHPLNYVFAALLLIMIACFILWLIFAAAKLIKAKKFISKIIVIGMLTIGVLTIIAGIDDIRILIHRFYFPETYSGIGHMNHWCTLQAVGAAGLIGMIAINKKTSVKLLIGCIILAIYTVIHEFGVNAQLIDKITQGGIPGALGWGCIVIFGMFIADLFRAKNKKAITVTVVVLAVLAVIATCYIGLSKRSVSPSYILLTSFTNTVFYLIVVMFDKVKIKNDFFVWWGRNPLVMYLAPQGILLIYESVMPDLFLPNPPVWLGIVQIVAFTAGFSALCYVLNKKNKIIKI